MEGIREEDDQKGRPRVWRSASTGQSDMLWQFVVLAEKSGREKEVKNS